MQVYSSFANVPLDDIPEFEGDDRYGPHERPLVRSLATFAATEVKPVLVVPFFPGLHEGVKSDAVYGVKRIVHRYTSTLPVLTAAPASQKRTWGPFFTMKLKRAQKRLGLPQSGIWDGRTHDRLAPWADRFALYLLGTEQEETRRALLAFFQAFYNDRYHKSYSQSRPTQLRPVAEITEADCSGAVAEGCWTTGILPNVDWRWTNTDVQILFGRSVQLKDVKIGDVAFYGHGSNPNHEAIVISVKPEVRIFSFGHFPASILELDYDRGTRGGRIDLRRFLK